MRSLLPCLLLLPLAPLAAAEPVDYLRQVKPVLAARCFACHGALKQEGSLRLDTARSILAGGDGGPAVVPGKSGASELIARVTAADADARMPPASEGSPLKPEEVAALKAWIDAGAAGPSDEAPEADPREHWAFRAPVRPPLPPLVDSAWPAQPLDVFLRAAQEKAGLRPQPPADKRLLLRRVTLDLIGLPPTVEELEAFVADDSPDAYERVVDRLLASPQHGERWGRHWMDIWRYSDWWGLGADVRNSQKHIWHWRDWIRESLDRDVGYDEMLRQMLAADELYPDDLDKLRGTGFLVRHYFKFNRTTWLDETLEHTSKALLGLTLNCAKCHDHKYDPIGTVDYYRLRAFFEPYQVRTDQVPGQLDYEQDGVPRVFDCNLDAPTYRHLRGDEKRALTDQPLAPGLPALLALEELKIEPVALPPVAHQPGLRPWVLANHLAAAERQLEAARKTLADARAALAQVPAEKEDDAAQEMLPARKIAEAAVTAAEQALAAAERQPEALRARAAADQAKFSAAEAEAAAQAKLAAEAEAAATLAAAARDVAQAELELLKAAAAKRADAEKKLAAAKTALTKAQAASAKPGAKYTPLPGALKTLESNLETAESRARPFPTTSTGRRSALAKWLTDDRHPLAARVAVNHVWNRHFGAPLVPTVFDFGRKGTPPAHPELLDWLAVELREQGWSLKRLHREIVTSSAYRLSSTAAGAEASLARDPENQLQWRFGGSRMEAQVVRDSLLALAGELDLRLGGPSVPVKEEASRRRSLYFTHSHNDQQRFLSVFDDAKVQECYRREQSIVPQQALALTNSEQALAAASRLARRLSERHAEDEAFVRSAFLAILASEPTPAELAACRESLAQWTALNPATARANLALALLNHNDFVTIR